jgi:hypothetical protein
MRIIKAKKPVIAKFLIKMELQNIGYFEPGFLEVLGWLYKFTNLWAMDFAKFQIINFTTSLKNN